MNKAEEDTIQLLALRFVDGACWTIRQQRQLRTLYKDEQCQSQLQLDQASELLYPHLQWLAAVTAQHDRTRPQATGLLIGLGGGDWLRYCAKARPYQSWIALDNQAQLLEWATQYFDVPTRQLRHSDAMSFLHQNTRPFQHIFVDLYPWPAEWQALLYRAWQQVSTGGWLAVNITANDTSMVLQWLQQLGIVGASEQPAGYQNCIWLGYKP